MGLGLTARLGKSDITERWTTTFLVLRYGDFLTIKKKENLWRGSSSHLSHFHTKAKH